VLKVEDWAESGLSIAGRTAHRPGVPAGHDWGVADAVTYWGPL